MIAPKFIVESIPTLMHLQICEALDKVIGEDYRRKLIDFENDKIQEISNFH